MENILIITYPFLSGLYYLAESFRVYQEGIGNKVFFAPKKSFYLKDNIWASTFKTEVSGFIPMDINISYSLQIINIINKYKISKVFSFETFMMDSMWVKSIIRHGIPVIDIPMPEWVMEKDIRSEKHKIFSEVLCLTNQSFNIFKNISNARKVYWDFCPDINLAYKKRNNTLTMYHPGSNFDNNQKNTDLLINSFKYVKHKNIRLILSGFINNNIIDDRIEYIGLKKNRQDIISAYSRADCVVSPSSREGLGLCFFEAKKMGCDIITTDAAPMREHSNYLCKVYGYKKTESIIPFALLKSESIVEQINKYYEDFYGKR
jgi:glycosyltransferase involved in cell wall biosynthesis